MQNIPDICFLADMEMIVIFMEKQIDGKRTGAAQQAAHDVERTAEDPTQCCLSRGDVTRNIRSSCFWKAVFSVSMNKIISAT